MSYIETTWICPCKDRHKVRITKPNILKPSVFDGYCDTCESKFLIRVSRVSTAQVSVELTPTFISPYLENYLEKQKAIADAKV